MAHLKFCVQNVYYLYICKNNKAMAESIAEDKITVTNVRKQTKHRLMAIAIKKGITLSAFLKMEFDRIIEREEKSVKPWNRYRPQ